MKALSFIHIKRFNRLLVLNLLRTNGPCSRKAIAERTGLALSAVANVINDLLAMHLIRVSDAGPSAGGRPPSYVEFNERSASVIGIHVGCTRMVGVCTDLKGAILARTEYPIIEGSDSEHILSSVSSVVHVLQNDQRGMIPAVAGVGIGVSGPVDSTYGIKLSSSCVGWETIPLQERLSGMVNLPVLVDNHIHLATLGEWMYGAGMGFDDLAYVLVDSAIRAGLIVRGALYYGGTHTAGEIGHTVVDPDGPRCRCGKYGCLESVASGRAICEAAIAAVRRGRTSSLMDAVGGDLDQITARLVAEQAATGDGLSLEIIERAGRYLGMAVAMLAHVLNPKRMVVGGDLLDAGRYLMDPLRESFRQHAISHAAEATDIAPAHLGNEAIPLGAAGRVVEQLFDVTECGRGPFPTLLEKDA